jgi:hypothetical protein
VAKGCQKGSKFGPIIPRHNQDAKYESFPPKVAKFLSELKSQMSLEMT